MPGQSTASHAPRRPAAVVLLACLFAASFGASAALPPTSQGAPPDEAAALDTTPQSAEPSLEQRMAQVRERLDAARLEIGAVAGEQATADQPATGTAGALEERRRLLRTLVRAYQQHLDNLSRLKELSSARADLESQISAWQGFDTEPPYSIDLVDGLRNDVLTKQRELDTVRQRRTLIDISSADATKRFKASEQALRLARERAESVTDPEERARRQLELELAQLRHRVNAAGFAVADVQRAVSQESVALNERRLEFLLRKLSVASGVSPLTEADRDAKLAAIEKERAGLEREIDQALEADALAQQQLQDTRDALRRLREMAAGAQGDPEAYRDRMAEVQRLLDTRQAVADTASQRVETLRLLLDALSAEQRIWEQRYETANTRDPNVIESALAIASERGARLNMWLDLLKSNVEATRALADNQKKQLEELRDGGDGPGGEQTKLQAYEERLDLYQRGLAKAESIDRLLRLWTQELDGQRSAVPVSERVTGVFEQFAAALRKLWDYELFAISDTIVVEDREITGKRSITVGKTALVLLLLTVGLWMSGFIGRRVYRFAVVDMGADVNAATLWARLLHMLLFVALLLLALSMVHIPITVFAFLGGALAIAVGFGAQNLINNFLSGLILLGERPIKVGDIVEVEGVRGRIVNVGGRCAQVRRFDGIDILVPNSSLLEKNVTNLTLSDERSRVSVTVGVAYGAPVDEAMSLIDRATREQAEVLPQPEPLVLFEEFGDNSLVFTTYFWIELSTASDYRVVPSNVRRRISALLAEAGIAIAYPQRDVHLDATNPIPVRVVPPGPGAD
jgi:small-conductance mechanosensitive channel